MDAKNRQELIIPGECVTRSEREDDYKVVIPRNTFCIATPTRKSFGKYVDAGKPKLMDISEYYFFAKFATIKSEEGIALFSFPEEWVCLLFHAPQGGKKQSVLRARPADIMEALNRRARAHAPSRPPATKQMSFAYNNRSAAFSASPREMQQRAEKEAKSAGRQVAHKIPGGV